MEKKIRLSIGIIFKNEIRCLERCLRSLEPLRQAVSCELVMADTGSGDGSRAVAEKYADILFDFPWINDFAAARNAVMDRCSGEWYFSIDADEWLDEDIGQLKAFLNGRDRVHYDVCSISERNYWTYDTNGSYNVFMPWRLLRLGTGRRYKGAIHEAWGLGGLRPNVLPKVLLHHDGYVEMNEDTRMGIEKRQRNMPLLREKLAEDPEDLVAYMQFIESGSREPDFDAVMRKSLELTEKKVKMWKQLGPPLFRYAVSYGRGRKLPETEEWLEKAAKLFLDSFFIRLDAAYVAALYYAEQNEVEKCIEWGERFLRSHGDFYAGRGDLTCQMYSTLQFVSPLHGASMRIVLSQVYLKTGRLDEALETLRRTDCKQLDAQWTGNLLEVLQQLHFSGEADTRALIVRMWEDIQRPVPNEEWAEKRKGAFLRTGFIRFEAARIRSEEKDPSFRRHVYTLYTPLRGECALGTAAAILESDSPSEMEALLGSVESWEDLPLSALSHAILGGVQFPLAGRAMNIEEMDGLAARFMREPEGLFSILEQTGGEELAGSWQTLAWARGLALAAVQVFDWKNETVGMRLAQTFAKVERAFITGCYTPEVLREGSLFVLPPMHRFGWYCVQAFDALEAGDTVGYVRLLREGVSVYGGMKSMTEFLLEHMPQPQAPSPSRELLELAEKVRTMLAAYPADDPAVEALKASPVYRKVAYLIEGEEA